MKLTPQMRWYIIDKKVKKTSSKDIQIEFLKKFRRSVSFYTIRLTYQRYLQTGGIDDMPRSGRPKALSDREERNLVRRFVRTPGLSIHSIVKKQDVDPIAQKPVCCATVRSMLRSKGLIPRTGQRGKELTLKNKLRRVLFAKKYAYWTSDDWKKVVFSDEARLFPERAQTFVRWSRARAPPAPEHEKNMKIFFVNVWGYMRSDGEVRIFRFSGNMNAVRYQQMLEDHLDNALAWGGR